MRIYLLTILFWPALVFGGGFKNFITAEGNQLRDGSQPFRFISFNVPTLNYQEDDMAFRQTNPYRLPDEFEMRDVFATVKEMGGQVIRVYTIPVRNRNFPPEAPTYVEGPGQFNETAFRVTDRMLALANEYGIRLIFPLLNNRQWMGGRPNYAAFRNKTEAEFWTDRQLIEDFKQTIFFTLNRINSITGVPYKDDKAILCWETGNELTSPIDWTLEITRYIKSLDKNHLVMDGWFSDDLDEPLVREESLTEWSIDMVSSHHYERDPTLIPHNIQRNIDKIRGRKVYLVGEFGFASTSAIENVLNKVIAEPQSVMGALLWSLRHHSRDGGFYWHSEPLGAGLYKALHWPGFPSGIAYDETNLLQMFRRKAFEIQQKPVPPPTRPQAPELLPIAAPHAISWRGSVGASGYHVERAEHRNGPWLRIGNNISDAEVPYFPLFNDATAIPGEKYFYRILATNSAGTSPVSNTAGPVVATRRVKLDTMQNLGVVEDSRAVSPVTGGDRSFKEIRHRLAGDYGSEVVYRVPGQFEGFDLYAFEKTRFDYLQISLSEDGRQWREIVVKPQSFVNAEANYNYWRPKLYQHQADAPASYIKIFFKGGEAQLARMEIFYR